MIVFQPLNGGTKIAVLNYILIELAKLIYKLVVRMEIDQREK